MQYRNPRNDVRSIKEVWIAASRFQELTHDLLNNSFKTSK